MHIANHPAFPIIPRVTTAGRLLGDDLDQLEQLGYKPIGRLGALYGTDATTIRDRASRGDATEHDLLAALALDAKTRQA